MIVSSITSSSGQFVISGQPTIVDNETTETFIIALSGSNAGSFNSIITIASDDADEASFTFPVTGTITKPEINVYEGTNNTGLAISDGQSTSIDFGSTTQANDISKTFAIENTGTSILSISGISVSGGDFSVSSSVSAIASGITETFTVTLSGINDGIFNGSVSITSDDQDEAIFDFPITGTITASGTPEIDLFVGSDNSGPAIADSQTTAIDLGSLVEGNDIVQNFTIENTGTSTLNISSIGSSSVEFSLISVPTTIVAGSAEVFTVTLPAANTGTFNTTITINNDDADENPFTFPITGTITAPEINVFVGSDNTGTVISDAQTAVIDFGNAIEGNDIVQTFAIENTGTSVLNVPSIASSAGEFTVSGAPSSVSVGATETFIITLDGSVSSANSSTITITSDDADETLFTFPVTGTITAPEINVFVGSDNSGTTVTDAQIAIIDFGNAVEGNDIVQTFAIENTGTSVLNIASIGSSSTAFTLSSVPTSVAVGSTEVFTITLGGTLPGVFNSTVTIASDDADENPFTFSVTGIITVPEINVFVGSDNSGVPITDAQTTVIDFGTTVEGNNTIQTFAIENTGTSVLNIASIGSSSTAFTLSSVPISVAAGSTEVFIITLDGSLPGVLLFALKNWTS